MIISEVLHRMEFGVARRELIIEYLKSSPEASITVNRRWCVQLKYDLDLQKLLKKGVLKRVRIGRPSSRNTYLVLN